MARFSIGTAIGDGFRLVTGRPVSVFVWGLLMLAPSVLIFVAVLPAMGEVFANMPDPDLGSAANDDAFTNAMMADMMQFQLMSMLSNLGQLLVMAVIYTAVFRAVLRPREKSFFSLRLGMDELRVAVVGLAIGAGMYFFIFIAALACIALGFGFGMSSDDASSGVGVAVLVLLVAVLALLWALARVSLMAPASVLYRDFAFVQGWKLASGKGWALFGMNLLLLLMVLVMYLVIILVAAMLVGGLVAATASAWESTSLDANPFADINAWMIASWPWLLVAGLFASLIYGMLMTLMIAPFASACRQLAESAAPPAEPVATAEPEL